jgi:hypothetical protein
MATPPPSPAELSRRAALAALLGGSSLALLGRFGEVLAAAAGARAAASPRVLDAAQFADLRALAGLIIPADDTPGAIEAGVPEFIDAALASFFAASAGHFLAGLADLQSRAAVHAPALGAFAGWPVAAQQAFLPSVEQTPFFAQLRDLTVLGLLAMPAYGGNRNGLGWQLIGFVDQHAFSPPFGYYDRDYPGFEPGEGERR